ncbi:ABC transporter substrate-binding protein [Telmatobacter sp. DSM 110680]|uniref:ABC transporter substrate-binding protein n=1 Tax=Telmatobacter sp. DSM 110680 TaxID=3036704 RepID=A0AAU7DNP9_9BACT
MRKAWLMMAAGILAAGTPLNLVGQGVQRSKSTCECGAHPPGTPKDRVVAPYAGEPADLSPYSKFAAPYDLNYVHPNIYTGAGRDIPEPKDLTEVRIGFFGPIEHSPEQVFGLRMLHGAQLAVEEANARGGYGGKSFKLMLHNDYDNWQAKTVYGDDRATDPTIWGSASNEVVKMVYDDQDWAVFGSISSESTHIALRVALKAEIPIVNSASTDPTIPETYIPWYFTDLQDDRVQGLTLARHIYTELGLKRVALLRVNSRYGRFGVLKFRDASRRLGHPVVIEQKFLPGDTDYTRSLKIIQSSRADAIVLWADEIPAANILKQMKALGMKQRVFGSYRTLGPEMLAQADGAAEGFEAVFPYDPTRNDPKWLDFNARFESRFHEKPEQFASLAYDAMNALLDSICRAGLNRARIHDALADIADYDGVTGHMTFDPNQKNVAHMYLGTVHNGAISYQVVTMEKASAAPQKASDDGKPGSTQAPYARVGEEGVEYAGPHQGSVPAGALKVVLFGQHADAVAQSAVMLEQLRRASASGVEWTLLPIASDQNWGAASTQLVHALMDEHALAIVALDRDAAHLAEQLALKAFVPVVAISEDRKLTSTNVPWIFRLPAATTPAAAMRLIETAVVKSGANPEKLRDVLASGQTIDGVAFLSTGEPKIQ